MRHQNESQRQQKKNAGFSLIELVIALAVLGLILGSMLQAYRHYTRDRPSSDTTGHFGAVYTALSEFLTTHARLPCPANPALASSDVNAGMEYCPGVGANPAIAVSACLDPSGFCSAAGSTSGLTVLSGAVPYATLGLSIKDGYDGWARKIQYSVTEILTKKASYNKDKGDITVNDPLGNGTVSKQIIILSHGKDGRGAYTAEGKLFASCPATAAEGRDFENCNNGANAVYFNDDGRGYAAGANYYDDYVYALNYDVLTRSDLWNLNPGQGANNTANGFVGIGTKTPSEYVDVDGNIVGQWVETNAFCNKIGADIKNCFPPQIIGGTGINCQGGTMTGIANANALCGATAAGAIVPGTCPDGQFMVGINPDKTIKCQ